MNKKTITQEKYNEQVREFMEDFMMTPEEAIDDAVQHFEYQGMDLSNIVKDLVLNEKYEPIPTCLERLERVLKDKNYELLPETLKELHIELDKDIRHRVFAGKRGCYNILIDLLKDCSKTTHPVVKPLLEAITSLMTGNPDLLDKVGVELQMELLRKYTYDAATLQCVLQWIRECCIKHEVNRHNIFDAEIFEYLKKILMREDVSVPEIKDACSVVRALVLDDDIRHSYGLAFQFAVIMARNGLDVLTGLLSRFKKDKSVVGDLLITLASLIVRHEFCQAVEDAGGLAFIQDVMTDFPDSEKINWQALKLLQTLAGHDEVRSHIVTSGYAPLIVSAVRRLKGSEYVVAAGLGCMSALILRNASNAGVFYDCGAAEVIVDAMKAYPKSVNVLQKACWAVRNMSVRNKSESAEFVTHGIEDVLQNALQLHDEKLEQAVKAAQRDLGLKVDLKERWTGKGVSLNN